MVDETVANLRQSLHKRYQAKALKDLPETLYHYTDIRGLEGIATEGKIWATDPFYMNDITELDLGIELVRSRVRTRHFEICNKYNVDPSDPFDEEGKKLPPAQREIYDKQMDARYGTSRSSLPPDQRKELTALYQIFSTMGDARGISQSFVTSLSKNGDQLSQWRAYGRSGYCIGFSTSALTKELSPSREIRKVVYYDVETADENADGIIEWAKIMRDICEKDTEYLRKWILASELIKEALFIKDSNFEEEDEYRIAIVNETPDQFFTPGSYGMVPRVKFPLPDGAITSVRVGPGPHAQLRLRSVSQYVSSDTAFRGGALLAGDDRRIVVPSNIPYRERDA